MYLSGFIALLLQTKVASEKVGQNKFVELSEGNCRHAGGNVWIWQIAESSLIEQKNEQSVPGSVDSRERYDKRKPD